MATPERTQKQIAERYKGNLGYYKKLHPWRLARMIVSALAILGGVIAIYLFEKRPREEFFNPGTISSNHATFGNDCAQCHEQAVDKTQLNTARVSHVLNERFHRGLDFSAIDRKCETCHAQHALHEPNVVENRSCSICHREHRGGESMKLVAGANCAACHDRHDVMQASAAKGAQLPPQAFHLRAFPAQQVVFQLPRPARGYTQVFASFADGHPEFQINTERPRDPDVLRFNHQRHEAADIPLLNGKKLDCNSCHKTDPEGRFYERTNFRANCQSCHSLQFDARNPEVILPHGDATAVRAFLHNLPTQYADLAVKKGLVRPDQIQSFVSQQILQLRERVRSGEDFEREVFFTSDPYKSQPGNTAHVRSSFYGCAFCHEVKARANQAPEITKPVFVDRWMPQAKFNHAKHTSVSCAECHHAAQSRETADVLMPAKANCVACHSPKGRVASECITCHTYHAPPQIAAADVQAGATRTSFKQMLTAR
ncbi:MAG: hypothetical protein M3Z64_06700 [Verrucomicrobiota bacterium]|nr:hypothetical protein [Verrucomicrobiota bacterium]